MHRSKTLTRTALKALIRLGNLKFMRRCINKMKPLQNIKNLTPKNLLVILGPTASGKSELAVQIAQEIKGEIISADSRQVYKDLNIGTGKITTEEMKEIPHHLISFLEIKEKFSAGAFKKKAEKIIREIQDRNKIPILCGGTGLFIDSVARNYEIPRLKAQEKFREKMEKLSREEIFDLLPADLKKKHPEKEKRKMIRTLELMEFKSKISPAKNKEKSFKPIFLGIHHKRERLYERINIRTKKMFQEGILDECKMLISKKLENTPAASGIGYKEGILFLKKEMTLSESISEAQKRARNYAKRQITWFRRFTDIQWIDCE